MPVGQKINLHLYFFWVVTIDIHFNKIIELGGCMVNITLFGTKQNINAYYVNLKKKYGSDLAIVESKSLDHSSGQVIISLTRNIFYKSDVAVEGFKSIGLKAVVVLSPFRINYAKNIDSDELTMFSINIEEGQTLSEFEELDYYEMRLGANVS